MWRVQDEYIVHLTAGSEVAVRVSDDQFSLLAEGPPKVVDSVIIRMTLYALPASKQIRAYTTRITQRAYTAKLCNSSPPLFCVSCDCTDPAEVRCVGVARIGSG